MRIALVFLVILLPFSAHAFCFQEAGQKYAVSPRLLWAIAKAESNFDPSSINRNRNGTIDVGLMQINSIWADQLGGTWDALGNPCTNVMAGAWILSQCIRDYGNTWQAVGCYHSRTPTRRDAYASRIAAILERARVGQ